MRLVLEYEFVILPMSENGSNIFRVFGHGCGYRCVDADRLHCTLSVFFRSFAGARHRSCSGPRETGGKLRQRPRGSERGESRDTFSAALLVILQPKRGKQLYSALHCVKCVFECKQMSQ